MIIFSPPGLLCLSCRTTTIGVLALKTIAGIGKWYFIKEKADNFNSLISENQRHGRTKVEVWSKVIEGDQTKQMTMLKLTLFLCLTRGLLTISGT